MPFTSVPWARQDAYARLPFYSERVTASDLHAGSITFLDLARSGRTIQTIAGYIDAVPAWLLARPAVVLVRWLEAADQASDAAELIRQRLEARGIGIPVGLVNFPQGSAPSIEWDPVTGARMATLLEQEAELLHRARRVELASYLHWGGAVWRPKGYHYRLPSGRHSRTYVRLADAFTDVRAAPAIATWLYRHLREGETTAVVVDSGTLGPLVTELRAAAERLGGSVAPVIGIDSYPPSALGLQQRLRKLTDGLPAVGLVSVSDTGALADRLNGVLDGRSSGALEVVIEQLVARGLPEGTSVDRVTGGVEDPWLSLGDPGSDPAEPPCEACSDPAAARLVRIDPRSMSALVLPEPDLLMPDLTDARRNASLWEAYQEIAPGGDESGWYGLTGPTGTRYGAEGPQDLESAGVFFEPAMLLFDDEVVPKREKELPHLQERQVGDPEKKRIVAVRETVGTKARVVVIDNVERELFADAPKWEAFKAALHPFVDSSATYFSFLTPLGENSLVQIDGSTNSEEPTDVLVVALGLRTGVTLHRMFLAARVRWPNAGHRGIVVHAHPHDDRIWASARNTFTDGRGRQRLLALWLTYLPLWSPFSEERSLLDKIPTSALASEESKETLEQRRHELTRPGGPAEPFWGSGKFLRGGSFLGEKLNPAATAVAVGAALQSARLLARPRGSPHWAMVDLPRTFRSYFDGLIHVSILRWCRPEECWWGERPGECLQLIRELQSQMAPDWPLILPELLLAGLQGKLPQEAFQEIRALASGGLSDFEDSRSLRFLTLGLELVAALEHA